MLPRVFVERLTKIVPEHAWEAVLQSFSDPQVTAFRINTMRATPETVQATLVSAGISIRAVAWNPLAFWVLQEDRNRLMASDPYRKHWIYLQNLSSMVPVMLLNPQKEEQILDLAAAPGSKTLQMAALMQNSGSIAAVEVVRKRFFQLQANLKAQGATNVRTFLKDGTTIWRHRPNYFDRVLIDAPCSTEARFREDNPETYRYWSLRKVHEMAWKQNQLLQAAIRCARPGGEIVYSTCSFAPEENEAVIEAVLQQFGEAVCIEPLSVAFPNTQPALEQWEDNTFRTDIQYALRILPTPQMEGFFVAKLRKRMPTD
ncbi:MAG TPA: RsmB/NOP family class I SAM-dependent RNA methyltransferase [Rhodothermales bacterium]|nr:RNA methyltransferase [Bacteroidota bacterium]HRK73235.1 RsmB/NOP family class I SAM-dependent RNA methyltransferase [Rhodothermales bacterium]HRR09009.1 RsmB/NOP family class I SAM-dependent RNA methyltransferase [Rhodothermales bacterium]